MSSPLALAVVTVTLCDLLNNGLIDNDLSAVGTVNVGALPPDRVDTGATEANRLNLFLYQLAPNLGWRNEGLPSHDARDPKMRLSNPPLALDLHYMLTAYGSTDFAAEILLGYAMDILHEARVLARSDIRRALSPNNPINVGLIPPDPQGRTALDLADQIEQIKISPHFLSAEELARLWTAMQARYRPTMAYHVSTILIQSTLPVRSALPVLSRGQQDRGVTSQPNTKAPTPSVPTLFELQVVPTAANAKRLAAELGDAIDLSGVLLDGNQVTAEFRHLLLSKPNTRAVAAGATATQVRVLLPQSFDNTLPNFDATADQDWPAGNYTLALRIDRAGKPSRRTNELPLSLAPRLSAAPQVAGSIANAQLTLEFFPDIWPDQRVEVFVGGDDAFKPGVIAAKTGTLSISIQGVTPAEGKVPVRLRVDGVDTQVVRDRSVQPAQFDPQQTVSLPS